jgi:hypothetical protein
MKLAPQPAVCPAPKETPGKLRQTGSPYRSGVLPLAREAIRLDVGSIPEVTFDFYCNTVLPLLKSDIDITRIKTSLVRDGCIDDGRWQVFAADPAKQEAHEDIVFAGLFDVSNRILKAAGSNSTQCIFIQKPHDAPTSTRTNMARPDGYRLYRRNKKTTKAKKHKAKGVAWEDIVEVEEYKKRDSLEDVWDVSGDILCVNKRLFRHSESR